MCGPAAIAAAGAGIQMAETVTAAASQDQEVKKVWKSDYADLTEKYAANQAKEQQEQARTSQEIINTTTSGMTIVGKQRAASASEGVAGATVNEREENVTNKVATYSAVAKSNLAHELAQNQLDAESYLTKAKSIENENQPANPLAVDLTLAGEAAAGASKTQSALHPAGS